MAKITDNSNELSFHQLTSTSSMLIIPLFQRSYVWTKRQLDRMIREIEAIADEEDVSRFLGAVIAVTRPTNPSQPTPYEVVDGQQRLTTLYLFLLAFAQVAAREGQTDYARGLISTNLIVDWAQDLPSNTKLQPSIRDRGQFVKIFNEVSQTGNLSDWLPVKVKLLHSDEISTGRLYNQFKGIRKYVMSKVKDHGFKELEKLVEVVRNGLTFVFILLKDPGSASTVFEGLNDPGLPISVGDLVKNEVFARIGYDDDEAIKLHENSWLPFRDKFKEKFDDYFFPFCVIHKSSASRTEMFSELRDLWRGLDSKNIIDDLDQYSSHYLALSGIIDAKEEYDNKVGTEVNKLVELRHPAATLPFLMNLLKKFKENEISRKDTVECLQVIESFLVRRAICGIEPTGLLGMFRTMWSLCKNQPNAEQISQIINNRLTIEWPSDERLLKAISERPLYGSSIAKFVILEYDRAQSNEIPPVDQFTIEHVMPQSYCESWSGVISKDRHAKLKDLWANLLPLSMSMNNLVAQSPYEEKRPYYQDESMFASTRNFGQQYEVWKEDKINERSSILADWAKNRWKKM